MLVGDASSSAQVLDWRANTTLESLCRMMVEADLHRQGGQPHLTMTQRVLVTGSEGFTGRYVCNEFARAGWEVWVQGCNPSPTIHGISILTCFNLKHCDALVNAPSPML